MSAPVPGIIGILTQENGRYARFWLNLLSLSTPPGTQVVTKFSLDVGAARNQILEDAVRVGAEWVWFLDDDHEFDRTLLRDLLAWDVDVVQPVVLTRYAPFGPVHMGPRTGDGQAHWRYALSEADPIGLKPVQVVGCGGMLIRRRAWEKLEPPYFRVGQVDGTGLSEDVDICRRLTAAGCGIFVDLAHSMSHLNVGSVRPRRKPDGTWVTILTFGQAEIEIDAAPPQAQMNPDTGVIYQLKHGEPV